VRSPTYTVDTGAWPDAGLDDVLHIGHVDAVARRLLVIQLDLDLRDRRLLEDRGAGGARNGVEHVDDLAPMRRSSFRSSP
jgi:hypothetical protein